MVDGLHPLLGYVALASAAIIPLAILMFPRRSDSSKQPPTNPPPPPPPTKSNCNGTTADDQNDVWAERRRRGIAAASSHIKKDAADTKPFASKYYYAHNNSSTTGGYKDGLTMEDFAMNGPRLLRRGGDAVQTTESSEATADAAVASVTDAAAPAVHAPKKRRRLPISKYLWDDPGDSTGIATIRIDGLPPRDNSSSSSSAVQPWSEVKQVVQTITTEHVGTNGMELLITTSADVDYSLRIAEFYGAVGECKAVSKAKRLLIRIHKKRGFLDRSNTDTWPHPQKKV